MDLGSGSVAALSMLKRNHSAERSVAWCFGHTVTQRETAIGFWHAQTKGASVARAKPFEPAEDLRCIHALVMRGLSVATSDNLGFMWQGLTHETLAQGLSGYLRILLSWMVLSAVVLLCSCQTQQAATVEPPPGLAFKGYELYSWPTEQGWCFALLLGTNRAKSYQEVTVVHGRLQGVDELRGRLAGLTRGEQVFWSANPLPGTSWPPETMIEDISDHCQRIGVRLHIGR